MQKISAQILILFLVAACSSKTKNSLGLTQTTPDEYQVSRNKDLRIPPHYQLSYTNTQKDAQTTHKAVDRAGKKNREDLSESEEALLKKID